MTRRYPLCVCQPLFVAICWHVNICTLLGLWLVVTSYLCTAQGYFRCFEDVQHLAVLENSKHFSFSRIITSIVCDLNVSVYWTTYTYLNHSWKNCYSWLALVYWEFYVLCCLLSLVHDTVPPLFWRVVLYLVVYRTLPSLAQLEPNRWFHIQPLTLIPPSSYIQMFD